MHILYVLCIGLVLGMQVICIELIVLYVRMFIPSENEHCGSYFIVIICLVKPWFITSFYFLLDRFVLASYALQVFLHTMIISCCCVSGDSCSYVSRVTQILELGVSEFCSTVLNSHVKSRVCFRVLLRNI